MPLSIYKKLVLEVKKTNMSLQLLDHSTKKPLGMVEDVLVKASKFIFPSDFIVLDMMMYIDIGYAFLIHG